MASIVAGVGLFVLAAVISADGDACVAGQPAAAPVVIDRALKQPLAAATSLFGRGQFAEASRSLQPILSAPQGALVFLDGRYVDAKVAANQLIARYPPEAKALYEREFGGIARRELDRAKAAGRIDQVLAVGAAYRHTEAGRQALAVAAGLFLDGGHFSEAAGLARELLETPGATQDSAAAARLVTAWLKLGEIEGARRWVQRRRNLLALDEIDVGGTRQPLDRWLLDRISQQAVATRREPAGAVGGQSQLVGTGPFERPATRAIWNKRPEVSGVAASLAEELIARRIESGIPPVFPAVPLVAGDALIVRRSEELAAYNLLGGQARWSVDLSSSGSGSQESEALADRAFSGGPQWALSGDRERAYAVVEDAATYYRPVFTPRGRRIPVELPAKNSLCAYDLHTGNRAWRLNEIASLTASSAASHGDRDVDFLGPPLVCGGTLYVLGRTDEGASLLALNPADGTVRWGESLAGFSGFEADFASGFGPACIPLERDGLLLCPMPEGMVIAIDLATRTCRWAYRAPPTEEPSRLPPRWGRRFPAVEARWLNGWRESLVRLDDRRCFFVSPRSSAIHALSIDTGKVLWTRPVRNGLFLGPIVDGRLLAVSQYRVVALDPASGAPLWSSPIGLPGGRGFACGANYLLPQSAGGLASLDMRTGAVNYSLACETVPLGNLVPLETSRGAAAICQSRNQVALLPSLARMRAKTEKRLRQDPVDRDALRELARLDREAGEFDKAEHHYQELLDFKARGPATLASTARVERASKQPTAKRDPKLPRSSEKSQAELLLLEEDTRADLSATDRRDLFETLLVDVGRQPTQQLNRAADLLRTADGDDEHAIALRTVGAALVGRGERLLGLKAYLDLAQVDLPSQVEVERSSHRVVAFDRELRADILELLQGCSPSERKEALTHIQGALERSLERGDLNTFSRAFQRLKTVGLDRALRRKIEAALRPDASLLQTQMDLWEAAAGSDTRRAAEAWRDLAEVCRSSGNRRQAADCYRRLAANYADVRFDDGLRPADLLAAARSDRPLLRDIEEAGSDPWPRSSPDAIPDSDAGSNAQFFHLPIEIGLGSLCERLDVALDHQGETLRFQGNGHSTYWDLRLPVENSRFRGIIPLHRAWGVGPLVIVQVGTDLFGVAPLDETGEPAAKILWHVDLLVSSSASGGDLDIRFIPGALAPGGERILITDRLGRPIARVGPVRPGYVCYQDRGSLIAIDPRSGRLLWRRTDVASADMASGDESTVLLLDRRSKRLQFLRALDGKTLAERAASSASDFRWLEALDAMTQVARGHATQLSRIGLFGNDVKWTASFPAETQFVRLDGHKYAAVEANGAFHILDADGGAIVASDRVPTVKHCVQVYATGDESRFYIAFSGIFADVRNFRANGQRDESRNPLVSGALCAVDRRTGRTLWSRPFLDGMFSLDQSRVAPILVFSYRQYRRTGADDEESGMAWPILHCIDKRTGRDVFKERFGSLQPVTRNFAETELGRREVIVRWPDSSIRFRYSR